MFKLKAKVVGKVMFLVLLLMPISLVETADTPHFIMSDEASIYTAKNETFNHLEVFQKTGSKNHIALDFHFKKNIIFFTNPESQAIIRNNKTDKTQLICNVSGEPTALAIDWIKDKVYYVVNNKDISTIFETNLDCSGTSLFITLTSTLIKDLVLDPLAGYFFWINEFEEPKIERCSLNGEGRHPIMSTGVIWPNALAFDYKNHELYVTDGKVNQLIRLDYEGHKVKNISVANSSHLFGVAYADNKLYVCDFGRESIWHNDPVNPDNFMEVPLKTAVYLIKYSSDRMQPQVTPVSSACDPSCVVGIAVGIPLIILFVFGGICVWYWKYRQHGCKFYHTVKGQPNQENL